MGTIHVTTKTISHVTILIEDEVEVSGTTYASILLTHTTHTTHTIPHHNMRINFSHSPIGVACACTNFIIKYRYMDICIS